MEFEPSFSLGGPEMEKRRRVTLHGTLSKLYIRSVTRSNVWQIKVYCVYTTIKKGKLLLRYHFLSPVNETKI